MSDAPSETLPPSLAGTTGESASAKQDDKTAQKVWGINSSYDAKMKCSVYVLVYRFIKELTNLRNVTKYVY